MPPSANLLLGNTQQFQAVFTSGTSSAVTWEVNGSVGGNAMVGTISTSGLYTAPVTLPSSPVVTVTAVVQSDSQISGSAVVNLSDGITISVSPLTVTVPTGGSQVFTATATNSSWATALVWSVNGFSGGNSTVGTIVLTSATTAIYSAPAIPPTPSAVTITATSAADSSKFGSATATITCAANNTISPLIASLPLAQTQLFTASFCIATGTVITWDVNGISGGSAALGAIAPSTATTALYTAPANLPSPNPVTIHATAASPNGGTAIVASASVTITSGVSVSVSPLTATLALSQRVSLLATVTGTPDTSVTWSVNGVVNGNASMGQICRSGTNPCQAPSGAAAGSVDFLAPAAVPTTNPVSVSATSVADPSRSGSASIAIGGAAGTVAVIVSPAYVFMAPSTGTPSARQFSATVAGNANTGVSWTVASAVPGTGCAGSACGSVNSIGLYTAPMVASSPNAIAVIATSVADPTKSASGTVALTSAPFIGALLPSSATAGAVEGFPLSVQGANFVAGSGVSASSILINGAARITTCASTTDCVTALAPADLQAAGAFNIQIQNPGSPTILSNPVPFVILPFNVSAGTTSLTAAQPLQTGEDILVTDPTTAAASSPISVAAAGPLTGANSCTLQGSPIAVTRPVSGTQTTSICVFGNGLDAAFTYTFTSPSGIPNGDIPINASPVPGLLPGLIELDLQITSMTSPGLRTLFITTVNNDRAVATGLLEVK